MTLAEKAAIIFGLATTGMLMTYQIMKPRAGSSLNATEVIQRRQEILKAENVRVLYSTMSFFYVQGYRKSVADLALFREILDVAKPKLVALQISDKALREEYQPVVRNVAFQDAIKRVEFLMKTKPEEVTKLKELDFYGGLENLLAIDYCQKNGCKIVCADESREYYDQMFEAKLKLKEATNSGKVGIPEHLQELYTQYGMEDLEKSEEDLRRDVYIKRKSEVFVEKLMSDLTPQFSLLPDVPYKVIVGIVEPEQLMEITAQWKSQFMSVYGHQILEDVQQQQQLQEQQQL